MRLSLLDPIGELKTTAMMREIPTMAWHQPIMVAEVLHYLNPHAGRIIVDGTVGTGGHSVAILPRLLPSGRLFAIDRDSEILHRTRQRLMEFSAVTQFVHGNYRNLPDMLRQSNIARVDGMLLDLGMSSVQVDSAGRGFSFSQKGPLDMRMDSTQERTAEMLVNTLTAEELAEILEQFGEERFARRIARHIVEARRTQRITTTTQLARLVVEAVPSAARHGRVHVATRTFQALRMAVNDELGALEAFLDQLPGLLNPGGRAVILTFHSLEDRIVKHRFVDGVRAGHWTVLTKKPVVASEDEVAQNPRARSAKLRAIERCACV